MATKPPISNSVKIRWILWMNAMRISCYTKIMSLTFNEICHSSSLFKLILLVIRLRLGLWWSLQRCLREDMEISFHSTHAPLSPGGLSAWEIRKTLGINSGFCMHHFCTRGAQLSWTQSLQNWITTSCQSRNSFNQGHTCRVQKTWKCKLRQFNILNNTIL